MPVLETILPVLTGVAAKHLLTAWLGEEGLAGKLAAAGIDLAQTGLEKTLARRADPDVEQLAQAMIARVRRRLEPAFRSLDEGERGRR